MLRYTRVLGQKETLRCVISPSRRPLRRSTALLRLVCSLILLYYIYRVYDINILLPGVPWAAKSLSRCSFAPFSPFSVLSWPSPFIPSTSKCLFLILTTSGRLYSAVASSH